MSNQSTQHSTHTSKQVTKNLLQHIDVTQVKELLPHNEFFKSSMSESWSKVIWSQCTS
ncbi:hypothetical protein [Legionella sp.]|uniref:hypothetical protein n=1 Tax=Legionella sp. TaxID=459 RepID=UPI003CA5D491